MTTTASWLETWTPDKVANAEDPVLAFCNYAHQKVGIPWPTLKSQIVLRARIKQLFAHYPQADFYTLCRIAAFARSKKRRVPQMYMVVDLLPQAWEAGALPELDPDARDDQLQNRIQAALRTERQEWWRERMILASTNKARLRVLEEWERSREA